MSISTILLFLIGDRDAILQIASDRWTLAIGFLFVVSAGFARNYARKDLRRQPWYLAIPFVASIVSSLGLFAWLTVVAWWHEAAFGSFVTCYFSFLGLYWLTAPLAWLYSLPVERRLSRAAAVKARLAMLAIVAAWRVAVIVRVLYIMLQANGAALFFAVSVYVSGLAVVAIWLTSRQREQPEAAPEVISFMGAMPTPSRTERRLIRRAGCFVVGIAVPSFAIGAIGLWATYSGVASWQFVERTFAGGVPPRLDIWLVAGGSILVWLLVLPTTQRRLVTARRVQELSDAGDLRQALNAMTEAGPNEFPPGWEPPLNRFGRGEKGVRLLDAIEATLQCDSTHWLVPHYREQLEDFASDARWFWETKDLAQLGRLLEQLPYGQHVAAVAWKSLSELTSYHQSVLGAHREIMSISDKQELLGDGFLDPDPTMTKERTAALDRLQQISAVRRDTDES